MMWLANKIVLLSMLLLITLSFVSGMSVIGLLQSTEKVNSSGIVTHPPPPSSPPPPPPEPDIEIDVYSDNACTKRISSVEWGSIEAGRSRDKVIYVKNNGDHEVSLSLSTDDWLPSLASSYLRISWDYDGSVLQKGAVKKVTLTLTISSSINGISNFNFNIVITGSAS